MTDTAIDPHTVVSLRQYMDSRLEAMDKAITLQFRSNEIAISKAESAVDYRLANLNEFRQSLADQTKNFVTRAEFDSLREAHESQMRALSRQVYLLVGAITAIQFLFQYLVK